MTPPRLIVGLGNPGPEYEDTRHNAGFWFVDRLAADLKVHLAPQPKFFGEAGKAGDVWLLKPATFMNRSGQAVAALARFYKIAPEEVLVVHDELDLLPGAIRVKQGGGNGGHNGLKDIQAQLGTPNFWRLRLGIGHPRSLALKQEVVDFVLHRPRVEEQRDIDEAIDRCRIAWPKLAAGDYGAAQQSLHGKPTP
ncbi:aminoacyl-tRNA hydrolase [Oryzomicrobium sp.]|uniref:aminoacyl-tRNA hydrolase n=1 Tax=Oryzomicrobium sp. TaxID=1911578 RepID=UPI002FDF2C15